jgi:hypothetical protein
LAIPTTFGMMFENKQGFTLGTSKMYFPIEEYYLLGYNAMYSVECQPVFRGNISPPSSGSKNRPSKKPA